jgi:outer membrane protein insertion porin family
LRGTAYYNVEDIGILDVSTNAPNAILQDAGYTVLQRFGTSLAYDTRGPGPLPNKGQQTEFLSELSIGDRDFVKMELKTDWYFKGLAEGHVLQVLGKAGVAQKLGSQDVPFFDRYYLGGQYSLRGYDYRGVGPRAVTQDGIQFEPIGGDTYWFGSLEYSIPVGIPHVRVALFYDIGNVSAQPFSNAGFPVTGIVFGGPPGIPFLHKPIGTTVVGNTGAYSDNYGLGLHIDIPHLGPLRLDYGIPIHHDQFNGSNGKFQFGVGFTRPL